MLNKKSIITSCLVMVLTFAGSFNANTYDAKADVALKNTNPGVVVKSVEVNTKKVITVPKKEVVKNSAGVNVPTLNRGGSGRTDIISYAYKFMGVPYVWGASGPGAFDCSGFTAYVYRAYGVSLPHYTGSQFAMGSSVSRANLSAGDLVFFNTVGSISHVGIYIGGGTFIHASSGSGRITVSNLNESYYSSKYAGARRILN